MKDNALAMPFLVELWRAYEEKQEFEATIEVPLFSDAHIIGELNFALGPYRFLNPVKHGTSYRPSLILRFDFHGEIKNPSLFETDVSRYHGGDLADEWAALLSLCLGIRLKAGSTIREFRPGGDPMGWPKSFTVKADPIPETSHPESQAILPSALQPGELWKAEILQRLPDLASENAIALIRAARLYQEAIWIVESTPELSWLMLVSAVETLAVAWSAHKDEPLEELKEFAPDIYALVIECGDEFAQRAARRLSRLTGSTRKFREFLLAFLPPPPPNRPAEIFQVPWEKEELDRIFRKVYQYRSQALHAGIPFPAPMWMPAMKLDGNVGVEKPPGLGMSSRGGGWQAGDIPILLSTFEYIVRGAALAWLEQVSV